MVERAMDGRLFTALARVLAYPGPDLAAAADECLAALGQAAPAAAESLQRFRRFVGETAAGRLEEVYTAAFDLQPLCCPYVGYHLFGESYKRGAFMVKLKETYREHGYGAGAELPDHLAVFLGFLALLDDTPLRAELIDECLVPALTRMAASFASGANPYAEVIRALLALLGEAEKGAVGAAAAAAASRPAERR